MHYKVNVTGTQNVVDACVAKKVKQLIYTSSANVVFGGFDIKGGGMYAHLAVITITEYLR